MNLNNNPTVLIDWFDDFAGPNPYSFLSNFYEADVVWDGRVFPSTEHAFAYAKVDPDDPDAEGWRRLIATAPDPGTAKAYGRKTPLHPSWEIMKFAIMQDVVWEKFAQHAGLAVLLRETGTAYLQEGTFWDDRIWGVDLTSADDPFDRIGTNWLGMILMHTRARLEAM